MQKLNVGGGQQKIEGFTNIDLCAEADVRHDLRKPLPFEDNSVDEIIAIHVIESFNQWEIRDILKDWARVLKGVLTIEFTVLTNTIELYQSESEDDKLSGHWGLYGRQDIPIDPIVLHHYVYEIDELENILKECGFSDICFTRENVQHNPKRDIRVLCSRI